MPVVKYHFAESFFSFDASFVPEGYFCSYDSDTFMYHYLNSHLLPSDIYSVRVDADGVNASVVILYYLRKEIIDDLPPFRSHPANLDIPF